MSKDERPVIELPLGQTAKHGQCGSCHYFGRRDDVPSYMDAEQEVGKFGYLNKGGYCKFKLPPQIAIIPQGEGAPSNNINDTGSCDLWRSSGKVYIEKHKVVP